MTVNDFYNAVSSSFQANRSNIWIIWLSIALAILFIYFYFRYMRQPENVEIKKAKKIKPITGGVNPVMEEIFKNETSETYLELKNNVNSLIDRYIEKPLDPVIINSLNSKYWEVLAYILSRKFTKENPGELQFTNMERLVIDFGYFSQILGNSITNFNEKSLEDVFSSSFVTDPNFEIFSITTWLSKQLKDFIGITSIEKLNDDYSNITSKIKEANAEKENNKKLKKELFEALSNNVDLNKDTFDKIVKATEKLEKISDVYAFFKYKVQTGSKMTKEEVSEFVNIENFLLNSLRNERRDLFKGVYGGDRLQSELIKFETEIILRECEILNLVSAKGKCKSDLNKYAECSQNSMPEHKINFLTEKITFLKIIFSQITKHNQIEPILFMIRKIHKNLPDYVFKAMSDFAEADNNVFNNKRVKTSGYPSILLVPGSGNGIYNIEADMLVFPMLPLKDFNETVVNAMVLYRWENDENGDLRNSFHNRKKYKKSSFASLQKSLIKEYLLYIIYPQVRKRVMDKEIYEWFMVEIAPKKDKGTGPPVIKLLDKSGIKAEVPTVPTEAEKQRQDDKDVEKAMEHIAEQKMDEKLAGTSESVSVETAAVEEETGPVRTAALVVVNDDAEKKGVKISEKSDIAAAKDFEAVKAVIYEKAKAALNGMDVKSKVMMTESEKPGKMNILFVEMSSEEVEAIISIINEEGKIKDYLSEIFKNKELEG
ncbi:MAG TPA: hypothetical protein PKK26_02340 [Candidatus Wallbacteria bacterium]|nr:hypothetical protein [Candidatus Wallbacteria bacterium]